MNFLPDKTELGNLETVDVYEFYDIPSLFSCKNSSGFIYLVLSVDEDDESLIWLYLPISQDRLSAVLTGRFELRDAFIQAEDEFVFKIVTPYEGDASVTRLPCGKIPEDYLPEGDIKLSVDDNHIFPVCDDNFQELKNVRYVAKKRQTDALNLIFDPSVTNNKMISAKILSSLLSTTQSLFEDLGKRFVTEAGFGKLNTSIKEIMEMDVALAFPGSFGLQLLSKHFSNIQHAHLSEIVISKFLELIKNCGNEEYLIRLLNDFGNTIPSKYLKFLHVIQKADADMNIEWGSPHNDQIRKAFLPKKFIPKAISIIEAGEEDFSKEVEVKCQLIGINVRTGSFEIKNFSEGLPKYTGKISDYADDAVYHASASGHYIAKLKEIITFKHTGQEERKWYLLSLSPQPL